MMELLMGLLGLGLMGLTWLTELRTGADSLCRFLRGVGRREHR
jgi:hypothetical protein